MTTRIDDLTTRNLYFTSWEDEEQSKSVTAGLEDVDTSAWDEEAEDESSSVVLVYDKKKGSMTAVGRDDAVEGRALTGRGSSDEIARAAADRRCYCLRSRRCRRRIVIVVLAMIALVTSVATVLIRLVGRNSSTEEWESFKRWQHIVTSNRWSDAKLVNKVGSNQFKAIQWLTEKDNTTSSDLNDQKSRYALAVFFFSVDADYLMPENKHVCRWNRKFSSGRKQGQNSRGQHSTVGVICDDDGDSSSSSNVTQIVMPYMSLRGTLPEEIGLLDRLTKIVLTRNNIRGNLPRGVRALTDLNELRLAHNELKGTVPNEWFDQLAELSILDLSYNPQLTGGFPTSLPRATKLAALNLGGTKMEGKLAHLAVMPELRGLFLGSARRVIGPLDNALLDSWPKLEVLDLRNTGLGGSLPANLFQRHVIVAVDLSYNKLEGSISAITNDRGQINRIQFISLHNNRLTGGIPVGASEWENHVEVLDLHENKLEGTIPSHVGYMPELHHLVLSDNRLTGRLPGTVRELHNLRTLMLQGNARLTGVPQEICNPEDPAEAVIPYLQDFVVDCSTTSAGNDGDQRMEEGGCSCCSHCCYESKGDTCNDDNNIWVPKSVWDLPYVEQNFPGDDVDYLALIWESEDSDHNVGRTAADSSRNAGSNAAVDNAASQGDATESAGAGANNGAVRMRRLFR